MQNQDNKNKDEKDTKEVGLETSLWLNSIKIMMLELVCKKNIINLIQNAFTDNTKKNKSTSACLFSVEYLLIEQELNLH